MWNRPDHRDVRMTGGFWGSQLDKVRTVTAKDVLDKFAREQGVGVGQNYRWVIAGERGNHIGPPWFDGLICEVIRGVSDLLTHHPDPALEVVIDEYVALIEAAQATAQDGYINTYGTLICPEKRWGQRGGSNLWQHEIYNIGCLIEAGVHRCRASGDTRLLRCAIRAADCLCAEIGPPPKLNIVPGHPLIEEALVKLYRLLRDQPSLGVAHPEVYLELSTFFLDHRGVHEGRAAHPRYMGEYAQDHRPVREQFEAVGHAVRAALMYTGMVAAGLETGDAGYLGAARRLFGNVAQTKMHISGGIGAEHAQERFGYQYELPNDAYLETCAGVALCFWAGEMHRAFGDAECFDVFERVLYNNVLPGLSADGKRYFYENPLVSDGSVERWDWHPCPCCPPMFLKLMGALPDYVYSTDERGAQVNLFMDCAATLRFGGHSVRIEMASGLPYEGRVRIALGMDARRRFALGVRIPDWAGEWLVDVNGQRVSPPIERGYAVLAGEWSDGDVIDISLALPARRFEAHPYVEADAGRVALMRGPLLYCLEGCDNGGAVDVELGMGALREAVWDRFGDAVALEAETSDGAQVRAIPYYLWANRGPGEMAVWLRQQGMSRRAFSTGFSATGLYCAHAPGAADAASDADGWADSLYREFVPPPIP